MLATSHNYKKVGQMDPNESNFLLAAYNLLWTYIVQKSVIFYYQIIMEYISSRKTIIWEEFYHFTQKMLLGVFHRYIKERGNRRAWSFFMWHIQIGYGHIKNGVGSLQKLYFWGILQCEIKCSSYHLMLFSTSSPLCIRSFSHDVVQWKRGY